MNFTFLVAILFSVLVTSVLSGVFGMAGGLVLMGVLLAILDVAPAMALHGFAQLIANGTRAVSLFNHIHWRGISFYLIGFFVAAVVMWFVSFSPSQPIVYITLGVMPFVALLPWTPKLDFKRPIDAVICGLVNTLAHLTAGVSGPILDLFFVRSEMNRFQMIGTKAFTQCLGHILKMIYFGILLNSADELLAGFPIWFPFVIVVLSIVGTRFGGMILKSLSEELFRYLLRRLFLVVGSIYLIMGVWQILNSAS